MFSILDARFSGWKESGMGPRERPARPNPRNTCNSKSLYWGLNERAAGVGEI
ncbi:hypothetical protein ACFFYR_01215 [Paraburkholderia dipogonis]|uniref:hypothetical protein n=1 Tax=Paraburkholderia dipogonis TaxID=1211383 RepID=UPI0035E9EB06